MKKLMYLMMVVFMTLCFTTGLFAQAGTEEPAPATTAPATEEMGKMPESTKEEVKGPEAKKKAVKKQKKVKEKKKAAIEGEQEGEDLPK